MKNPEKFTLKEVIPVILIATIPFITNCGNKEGVCTGYSDSLNKTYCYDGWTESECKENDKEEVNGANWNFFADQTCASRGLSVGSN